MSMLTENRQVPPKVAAASGGWRSWVTLSALFVVTCLGAIALGAGLALGLGVVLGLAGFGALSLGVPWLRRQRQSMAINALLRSVESDPAAHFLTTSEGIALGHSPSAYTLSRDGGVTDLASLLGPFTVTPDAFLARLRRRAEATGSAVREIEASDAALKIVARDMGQGLVLWRVERFDLGAGRASAQDADRRDAVLPSPEVRTPADSVEDALPVAVMKIASDGTIRSANAAARALFRLNGPEYPPFYDLAEGVGRPVAHWLRDAIDGHGLNRSEVMRSSVSGAELYLQVTLGRIDSGEGPLIVAAFQDATELKSLEAQFVQSQKMQAIGQLAGGVAHDFNNLLTAISGHCDLLLLRHDEGDPDFADLMQISQNANRAASLVGQLLAFSRKQTMRAQVMDLADAMSDLTHLLNRLVGEKIALDLSVATLRKVIRADRRQFEQVIMNLVVNARDAMPEGGEIRIEVSETELTAPLERDRVSLPVGDYVTVRITDQGVGISPEALPKIFEPFYTTKKTGEGTGLGLSTAYGIVKQSGGYIFADSVVGEGTCFTLYFPASDRPLAELDTRDTAPQRPRAPNGEGVVLLVEDEAPVRAFAARALRMKGYTVIEAEDAEQALKRLEEPGLQVDLFVTDVIMPGLDGPSWVREALKTRPDTRIVFVSGYAEESLAENQARVPNSVFLPKPFSLSDLTTVVHQQLSA